ncbi:kinase-like protein, partial [Pluteus cervinus]
QGNGGSVMKVEHVPSGMVMAKKVVLIDAKSAVRKQILRELQIMHDCNSKYIVSSYGAYLSEPNICICMEFMDKGSFESIYKKIGPIDIQVVSKVAHSVLEGLTYLYDVHRIIHRDIKPSNILCNSEGQIKLCDFGVSGELINSIANTFVGTSTYMSPERIQGAEYSVKSDVWSLGITLVELAHGRFPFNESWSDDSDLSDLEEEGGPLQAPTPAPPPKATTDITPSQTSSKPRSVAQRDSLQVPSPITASKRSKRRSKGVSLHGGGMTMSIIELMHHIIQEPPPRLGAGRFPREADEFVNACLEKEIETRKTPGLLMEYAWINMAKESEFDVKAWAAAF